jgi:Predicted glycosyltransferases
LTYNALKYTKKCLESLEEYTKGNFEVIIVDNNSSDETPEWLKSFESRPRSYPLKVVYNKDNKGVGGGREQALAFAKGAIITFLDNDTEVAPGWNETIIREFDDNEVGVVGRGGQIVAFLKPVKFADPRKDDRGRAICDVVPGYCFSFRRDLIGIVGGQFYDFPNKTFWHEDLDFCMRVQMAGYKILTSDEIPVKHYEHKSVGENVSNKEMVEKVEGFYENAAFIQERFISDNIVYIYRDWGGFDSAASYDRVANALGDSLRRLGMIVIRRPSFQFGPPAFSLCKGFDILHRGKRFVWLHQENDRCPADWQGAMKHVDYAFAASPHVLEVTKNEPYHDKIIDVTPDGG